MAIETFGKRKVTLPTGETVEVSSPEEMANITDKQGLFWVDDTGNYRFIGSRGLQQLYEHWKPDEKTKGIIERAFQGVRRKRGATKGTGGFLYTTGRYRGILSNIANKMEEYGIRSSFQTKRSKALSEEKKQLARQGKSGELEIQKRFWNLKPQTEGGEEMAKRKPTSEARIYADTPLGRSIRELDDRIIRGDWERLPDGRVRINLPSGGTMTVSEEDAKRMQENAQRGSTMVGFNGGMAFLTGDTEERMLKDPKFREHINSLLDAIMVEGWGYTKGGTGPWGRTLVPLSELSRERQKRYLQRNLGLKGDALNRALDISSQSRGGAGGAGAAGGGAGGAGATGGTSPEEAFQREQGQQQTQQIGSELGRDISDLQRQIQQMAGERKDLIPQGEQLWGMAQPGLQSLSSYYNQLMQGGYAETPEGRAEQSKAMRSLNLAKDRIRKLYAQRGLTGSAAEQEALAKADIATGQTLATLPVAGRQQAMQYFGKLASIIPGYKPSGLQSSQLSSLVGLASILSGRERTAAGLATQLGLGSAKTKV